MGNRQHAGDTLKISTLSTTRVVKRSISLTFSNQVSLSHYRNMAGGTSIWASREAKTDPKEIFNLRLLYLGLTLAWAGCFYGFDTGNIGGILTLPSFEHAFGLIDIPQADIDNRKVGSPSHY
jgi:hypothetical protein